MFQDISVIYRVSSIKINDEHPLANIKTLKEILALPWGEKSARQTRG